VLITTKDPGKLPDKFTINYTGNVSIQQPTAIPDVVDDGYVYARLFYDAWYNYRFNEPTGFNNSQDFSRAWLDTFRQRKLAGNKLETTVDPDGKYVYYGNTDYYDALYKDTVIAQTHNVSISGSNGKISHYLSGRLYDYNGLFNFTPDTYRTMNLRSKVSSQVFKWLKISNNFDYTHDRYRQPMGYSKEGGGVLWRSVNDQGHPSSPIFNPDGTLTKSGAYAIGGLVTGDNWLDRTTKTLKNTTTLNVTMLENRLHLTGDFSFRTKDYTETKKTTAIPYSAYEGETVYLGTPETDDVMKESLQLTTYMATNAYAEFEDTFAEKHYFKALAGYNYEQQDYKSTYSERNGLLMPDAGNINFALGDVMSITAAVAAGVMWEPSSVSTMPTTTAICSKSTAATTVPRNSPITRSGVSSLRLRPPGAFRRRSFGMSALWLFRTSKCALRTVRWATATSIPTPISKRSVCRPSVPVRAMRPATSSGRPSCATRASRGRSPTTSAGKPPKPST